MRGEKPPAAYTRTKDKVCLHELEQSTRENSWKHTWETRGILQQRNLAEKPGTNRKEDSCLQGCEQGRLPPADGALLDGGGRSLSHPLKKSRQMSQSENITLDPENVASSDTSTALHHTLQNSADARLGSSGAVFEQGSIFLTERTPATSLENKAALSKTRPEDTSISERHQIDRNRGAQKLPMQPLSTASSKPWCHLSVPDVRAMATPREDATTERSIGSDGMFNSQASSPRSTIAHPNVSIGDGQRLGWRDSKLQKYGASPARSVSSVQSSVAVPSTPGSDAESGGPLDSQTPKGLRSRYQAYNALVSASDKALQLFGDPNLTAQCDTALHLDLEGIARAPVSEAKRISALLDAGALLRACLGQLTSRRDALLAYCMRYGAEMEARQRRAMQDAAQLAKERDQAVGYQALSQERQKRLEAALQEKEQEVQRLQALLDQMPVRIGPDLTLDWIRDSARVMELVQEGALPLREDSILSAGEEQSLTHLLEEGQLGFEKLSPLPSLSRDRCRGSQTLSPELASGTAASHTSSSPSGPTLCTFPAPDGNQEDDGFFNVWSWIAVLRA